MARYVMEFVGTSLLVLVVGMVVLNGTDLAALAIGGAVAAIVYTGYHVSGGQYNPAVTLGALIRGALPGREFVPYCAAQLLGGALGAVAASFLVPDGARPGVTFTGDALVAVLIAEFVFTFALVWVVLHVGTDPRSAGNSYFALAIAAVVVAGILAAGGIGGGVVNPAVTAALAMMGILSWSSIWIFVSAQLAGAAVAAALYVRTAPGPEVPAPPAGPAPQDARAPQDGPGPGRHALTT